MVWRASTIGTALICAALFVALPAGAGGLTPLQSDSACSAYVPGWQSNDYIKSCAKLITQLRDLMARCKAASGAAAVGER